MKKDIVKAGLAALAAPTFIDRGDRRGRENVAHEDLVMPRLALAQALSPEIEEGSARFIDGLKVGDAFNSLTGAVYGKEPIDVVIIRHEQPRFIEFNPMNEGGGVKDFNVAPDDPRTKFGPNGEKPIATKFLESVAILANTREPIALSFKGSGLTAARQLRGLANTLNAPTFAAVFALTPVKKTGEQGTYYVFTVRLKGWVDEPTYKMAETFFEGIKERVVSPEREAEPRAEPREVGLEEDPPF